MRREAQQLTPPPPRRARPCPSPTPQYQPKALDKFVLHKGIADNLKKLVSGRSALLLHPRPGPAAGCCWLLAAGCLGCDAC